MTDRFAIILAAGKGTRMKTPRPKVLHEIGGRSMLAWSLALAKELGCKKSVVVVGPDMADLSAAAAKLVGAENVAVQKEQLGTANAVDAARSAMAGADGHVIVLYADTPLIPKDAGERAFAELERGASVCVLGFKRETAEPLWTAGARRETARWRRSSRSRSQRGAEADRACQLRRDGGAGKADVRASERCEAQTTPRTNSISPTSSAWRTGAS